MLASWYAAVLQITLCTRKAIKVERGGENNMNIYFLYNWYGSSLFIKQPTHYIKYPAVTQKKKKKIRSSCSIRMTNGQMTSLWPYETLCSATLTIYFSLLLIFASLMEIHLYELIFVCCSLSVHGIIKVSLSATSIYLMLLSTFHFKSLDIYIFSQF